MFYNIFFSTSAVETVNKALHFKEWPNATSLLRKFGEATEGHESSPGYIIRISSEELCLLKSCIMRWGLHSNEFEKEWKALIVFRDIIKDIAENRWSDYEVEIS